MTDIEANARKATHAIEKSYLGDELEGKLPLTRVLTGAVRRLQLRKKAERFEAEFEAALFSNVEHATGFDSLVDNETELKSVAVLAEDVGVDLAEQALNHGSEDIAIGNASYVFANTNMLASRTAGGGYASNRYKITSEDGYAAPYDIAYTYPDTHSSSYEDYGAARLNLYADNIYAIPDFKKVFSLYSASLFETPQDAIGFYKTFKSMMETGNRWKLDKEGDTDNRWLPSGDADRNIAQRYTRETKYGGFEASDRSHAIALKMRQMLNEYGVYPPMEPEFQFRDAVQGERVQVPS